MDEPTEPPPEDKPATVEEAAARVTQQAHLLAAALLLVQGRREDREACQRSLDLACHEHKDAVDRAAAMQIAYRQATEDLVDAASGSVAG